ncbi:MAG: sigma-54-dependent transcriptional regulator [bacterium]
MANERILVVDDEESMCEFLSIMLKKERYDVTTVSSYNEAVEKAKETTFHAAITDINMPGRDGLDVLKSLKEIDASLPVIILTAYASQQTAIAAVNRGAFYYLTKQAKNEEIKLVLQKALEHRSLKEENALLKQELKVRHGERKIIGSSPKIEQVFRLVQRVANSDSTILLTGESGVGKELIARDLHYSSTRCEGPFVSINCGALPETLLESELFGHVRGSFTGAVRDKEGLFAVAKGGTFLLDEIGETSPAIQVKLLRVLQEREIIPVGGTKPVEVDVRLVAATNADLEKQITEGRFRADLYYRLNVIPIFVPPLRERRDDIPLLVEHFLRSCDRGGRKTISPEALELLVAYDWPGNVRELENIVERMVILQESDALGVDDLPKKICKPWSEDESLKLDSPLLSLDEVERRHLLRVLNETGWQKRKAAQVLGINASTLYRKLQRFGFEKEKLKV